MPVGNRSVKINKIFPWGEMSIMYSLIAQNSLSYKSAFLVSGVRKRKGPPNTR